MFDVLNDFEWFRAKKGYRIAPLKSLSERWRELEAEDVDWIVPKVDQDDAAKYRPFVGGGDLCAAFASVTTPHRLLEFINLHGPLTWGGSLIAKDANFKNFPTGDPVPLGLAEAEMFRELLQLRAIGNPKRLASHFENKIAGFVGGGQAGRVEVLPDFERGIRLKVTPPTLLGAMWYQLALKLSDAALRMCPLCRRVFEVGHGTGLRADAKFCCNAHKVEFFNRSRPKRTPRSSRINR